MEDRLRFLEEELALAKLLLNMQQCWKRERDIANEVILMLQLKIQALSDQEKRG